MFMAMRINRNLLLRMAFATSLSLSASSLLHAQAPGMTHTGPTGGIGLGSGGVSGNDRKVPQAIRVVQGTVLDQSGAPIKGAMVYLKNDKTSQVRSMLADANGKYRFMSLSYNDDYKLWAQAKEKKSTERPISSMDTRSELNRDLKIE